MTGEAFASPVFSVCRLFSFVKLGIVPVEILVFEIILHLAQRFAETPVVHDLALTQEFQRRAHVGIVDETKQIVIRHARFLFCCNNIRTTALFFAR